MFNKNLKEKIIEQKYNNKNELVLARNNLREMVKKIRVEQKKARLRTKKLTEDLKHEKHDFKNKDKVEKLKIEKKMANELSLVAENKRLLIKARSGLRQDIHLMKISQKNEIIRQKKKNIIELQNAKKQARLDKKNQKEKIAKIKYKFLDEKNILKKQLGKERQDNQKTILDAKQGLNKSKINILKKRTEVALQRKEMKEKAKAERKARITKSKNAKKELRIKKIEAKKKHNERILILKGKTFSAYGKNVAEIKDLEKSLETAKNEVHNSKKTFEQEKEKINDDYNDKLKKSLISLAGQKDEEKRESKVTITKWKDSGPSLDQQTLNSKRNINSGLELQKVGKRGQKLYDKKNSNGTKLTIEKIKLPGSEKNLILEMKKLKADNSLVDIREFAKYVAYLTDTKITNSKVQRQVVSPVVNILMNKTLRMFNGYFMIKKIGKYKLIKWTSEVPATKNNVVFPPKTPYAIMFEKVLKQKLEKGAVIQISNNIAIKSVKSKIIVLHDVPFLR